VFDKDDVDDDDGREQLTQVRFPRPPLQSEVLQELKEKGKNCRGTKRLIYPTYVAMYEVINIKTPYLEEMQKNQELYSVPYHWTDMKLKLQ